MKRLFALSLIAALCVPAVLAYDEYDDIYYNPSKSKTVKKTSAYIKNMADRDVDDYNRRGQYYVSDVDTIGYRAGSDEDFVYTQAIQKYYNPTIIVDNADLLADVLNNSYGNVQIEYNNYGLPCFVPSYSSAWSPYYSAWSPYYSAWSWGSPSWSIGWNIGPFSFDWSWGNPWSWGSSWGWGPSWSWGWGPSWSWGWGPTWGSSWGWGPSWGPSWGGVRPPQPPRPGNYPNYRPNGRYNNVTPAPGWAGGNYNGGGGSRYPSGNTARPGNSGNSGVNQSKPTYNPSNSHRTSGSVPANVNSGNKYGTTTQRQATVDNTGHRRYGTTSTGTVQGTTTNRTGNVGTTQNSGSGNSHRTGTSSSSNRNTTSSYNSNSSTNHRSSSTSSYNSNRSSSSGASYNRSSSSSSGGSRSYGGGSRGTSGGRGGRR